MNFGCWYIGQLRAPVHVHACARGGRAGFNVGTGLIPHFYMHAHTCRKRSNVGAKSPVPNNFHVNTHRRPHAPETAVVALFVVVFGLFQDVELVDAAS